MTQPAAITASIAAPVQIQPLLSAVEITQRFGDGSGSVIALDRVSLDFLPGQMTLIMGPAGSGKTTLLAVLSGLLRPTSGKVLALGEEVSAMSEREREHFRLRHCGFIFQDYNLLPSLNARQQLELILRWGDHVSLAEAHRQADAMLARLDLGKKGELMPRQLSGGEQQRVAVGRGLIKHPELCFADEPTAALDWRHGKQVVELLRTAAHESSACVLIAAHDERIAQYADRVICLENGRVQKS